MQVIRTRKLSQLTFWVCLIVFETGCPVAPPNQSDCQTATPDADIPLPIAPASSRVDLDAPVFSNPTNITNPLFPISELHSVVLLGVVDGLPFRTETTLLSETRIIDLGGGQQVETLVSQYMAYLDGRIQEVALDFYAQADDGAVWYLGEEVKDYVDGVIVSTDGTWLTCTDGPAAMIMPGTPQVDDAFRPENVYGVVFEEVVVTSVTETVDGPRGPVHRALIANELHADGTYSDKTFAPGYGEFYSASGGDTEALALAVPTDALPGAPPAELDTLFSAAGLIFATAPAEGWDAVSGAIDRMTTAWNTYQEGQVSPRLAAQMNDALDALTVAAEAQDVATTRHASIQVARAALDFQLRHRPPSEIDLARFDLFVRQLLVDADAGDLGGVSSDVTTLEWIRDRFAHALDGAVVDRINNELADLRVAADGGDPSVAMDAAVRLWEILAEIGAAEPTLPHSVPDFSAARFTNPTTIDNPFFPLTPGTVLTYQGETTDGTERIVLEVLTETRVVMGVTSRVVRDRAFLDDVIVEDTFDWYAQDDAGNVWYMGEEVDDYNYGETGNFIDITHGGVWEAGKDVVGLGVIAKPGHQMRASPAAGDIYHQEFYPGAAEDMGEVVAVDVPVTLGDGTTYLTVQIRDSNPLGPNAIDEYKYYAPGIGLVLEEPITGEDRIELVTIE